MRTVKITPPEKRFWKHVEKTETCWIWKKSRASFGYGQINLGNKKIERTHRFSYILHFGDIPEGMCVLHRCDNPPCVNPDHLFLGTKKDNAIDCANKGRNFFQKRTEFSLKGEKNRNAKFTDNQIFKLKRLLRKGISRERISKWFGIDRDWLRKVDLGQIWKHVVVT